MGDTSRKVKNPLLSAAGVSFPFEDFSGSALLMPVTPATPSILQDVGEIASFVGQSSQPTDSNLGATNNTHAGNVHQQFPNSQPQLSAPPATSEICLTPFNEPTELTGEFQPQKQGYLSSFLSSLPNLSLSSITGDSREDVSAKSSVKDQSSFSSDYNAFPPYYAPVNSYDSGASYNPGTGPPISHPDNSYGTAVPPAAGTPNWFSPDNIPPTNVPPTSTPPVQPPPVALPPTGTPSSSYRLGNQRRLKYAPPPDLATSNPRVNNLPFNLPPQPSFPSVPGPAIFQQQRYVAPGQNVPSIGLGVGVEQNQNYNREITLPASTPQNIPARFSTIESQLEPATPQNTPANPTHLSSFVSPGAVPERDWSLLVKTPPKKIEDDNEVLREIDLTERSTPSASLPPPESLPEDTTGSEKETPPPFSSPFAPISAARVSEKLENLLAARKEESTDSEVEKALEIAPPISETAADSVPGLIHPKNNFAGADPFPKSLNEDKKTIVGYFAPTTTAAQTSIPSFYDPTKFQEQVKPLAPPISDQQSASGPSRPTGLNDYGFPPPAAQTIPSEKNTALTFYNPSQFAHPTNFNSNVTPQCYPTAVNLPPSSVAKNTQNYFYSGVTTAVPDTNIGHQDPAGYFTPPSPPPMATAVPEPTGSATLDPIQMSVNPLGGAGYSNTVDSGLSNLPPSLHNLASGTPPAKQMIYRPVYQHWFHRKEVETKILWLPFSMQDSLNLEEVHNSTEITPETTVATDGGRYDVDILRRLRTPVYWSGTPNEVRRCSWFYKGPAESRYVPYEESVAARLEEEFQQACNTDVWNRRIDLNNGEYIIFHSATVQVHYLQPGSPELTATWGTTAGAATRPRVVKRGVDEFNIDEGEPDQVDHLLFLVHGIGSVCDLKFRSVEEVVDEFRSIALQLVQSHYRSASEQDTVHKIEVLPISWHTTLHSDDTGIDKKLQAITLESIPKLRHFTNDTLSDILFYTSPIYCQTIMQTVGNEMNRLHNLFKKRNPTFEGGIYVGGHSLGSLILFDLLCHQKPPKEEEIPENVEEEGEPGTADVGSKLQKEETVAPIREAKMPILKRRLSRKISYVMGAAGTGQPYINYPQLNFHPSAFFALGSPIGMFVTVRGIDTLGEDFALPTCPSFFNIFHPFDPVAYRIEALIHPDAKKFRPKLIPHHKGRKRMHLELKETMARVGADLKQKLLDSVRSTWNSVYQLAMFHRPDNQALEREIDKVVEEQLQSASNEPERSQQQIDDSGDDIKIGKLNGGRRVDYVLQEAPFEYINEYIFALTSHVCYWESEDTMLMMLKEIYGSMGIQSDAQLPQQTLTIERASPSPVMPRANTNTNTNSTSIYGNSVSSGISHSSSSSASGAKLFDVKSPSGIMGMDPTAPISDRPVGPPPTSGFMRKL